MNQFKILISIFLVINLVVCKKYSGDDASKPKWAKKDVRDYSDADLERLLEQWEEDEDPLPPDELPEWDPKKPQPKIDLNNLDMSDPETVLKMSKKGKTLMMFVKVSGNPSRPETEEITSIWQTGLWNNHIQCDRFVIEDNRVIFQFKDGSVAWEAKDFIVEQERCASVEIEQKTYHGKYTSEYQMEQKENKKDEKKKKKKSTKKKKTSTKTEL